MKLLTLIGAALVATTAVASQPAAAASYTIKMSGRTMASRQLTADILNGIAAYSKANGGCSFISTVQTRIVGGSQGSRGGHAEIWTVGVCAAKQRFRVNMRPSPRGGADYAIEPITGRMPLHTQ